MSGGGQTQKTKQTSTGSSAPLYGGPQLKSLAHAGGEIAPTNLNQFQPQLQSYIGNTLSGTNTPGEAGLLGSLENSVRNTVGGQFAAAGRSFSPSHAAALGTALTNAEAPYLFSAYQNDASRLPQMLSASAGLPFGGLTGKSNFLLPIAGAGQNTTGTSTGTITQPTNPWQTALGAGLGGVGLLGGTGAFGNSGWLTGLL